MHVYIRPSLGEFADEIVIYEERLKETYVVKPMKMEWEKLTDPGRICKPSLIVDRMIGQEWYKAFQAAIDKRGITPASVDKMEGILTATKFHLEDMRNLVFKKGGEKA